jgi:RNA polymerase sigma factor (sigma-70 family)
MTVVREGAVKGADVTLWRGDSRLTELVRRRGPELLRIGVLLTGSRYDAEDALQEALLSVARAWPRLTLAAGEPVAFAYLRTALIRKAIDDRRRRMPTAEPVERGADEPGFLRFEEDRRFFALVRALPPQQRAVLVLRYYLDLDDRRIAGLLGCSRATVRSNAMRGLERLRAQDLEEER